MSIACKLSSFARLPNQISSVFFRVQDEKVGETTIREFGGLKSFGGVQDMSIWFLLCEQGVACIY